MVSFSSFSHRFAFNICSSGSLMSFWDPSKKHPWRDLCDIPSLSILHTSPWTPLLLLSKFFFAHEELLLSFCFSLWFVLVYDTCLTWRILSHPCLCPHHFMWWVFDKVSFPPPSFSSAWFDRVDSAAQLFEGLLCVHFFHHIKWHFCKFQLSFDLGFLCV